MEQLIILTIVIFISNITGYMQGYDDNDNDKIRPFRYALIIANVFFFGVLICAFISGAITHFNGGV